MDKTNYTTEHRKGQHLTSEERHIIEVRFNKDKQTIYGIAKELGRPYNTVKNEIMRGTVLLYNGKVRRYKAEIGYSVYLEHRRECRRKYRCLETSAFLQYVSKHFREDKWSLDAYFKKDLFIPQAQRQYGRAAITTALRIPSPPMRWRAVWI